MIAFLLLSSLNQRAQPPQDLFPHNHAAPIFGADWSGQAAERIRRLVSPSAPFAFVSEDGTALAAWAGDVAKVDAQTGKTLTAHDRYRIEIRGRKLTAFNVSQEKGVRQSYRGAVDVALRPLVLLDRYRTLCVNGPLSASSSAPKEKLFLALIDDRKRGASPNLAHSIPLGEAISSTGISVVGMRSGAYVLRVASARRVRYLSVDPRSLASIWIRWKGWSGFPDDIRAIRKGRPGFDAIASARWGARSYFATAAKAGTQLARFMWDGTKLWGTDGFALVAASVNGRFGWVAAAHGQWLMTRRTDP